MREKGDETENGNSEASSLTQKEDRWLASYIESARNAGVISNKDLLKSFPPEVLFEGYKDEPESRGKLIIRCFSGFGKKTAESLDLATCITLVKVALEKRDISADIIFTTVTPSELVRKQDRKEIWRTIHEKAWPDKDTASHRALMSEALERYVEEELDGSRVESLKAIESAVTFENYVEHLPKEVLVEIIRLARLRADGSKRNSDASSPAQNMIGGVAFSADVLAEVAKPSVLAEHLPLDVLYAVPKSAAERFGWEEPPATTSEETSAELKEEPLSGIPPEALDSVLPPKEGENDSDDEEGDPEIEITTSSNESVPPGEVLLLDGDLDEEEDEDKTAIVENPLKIEEELSEDKPLVRPPALPKKGKHKR